MRKTTSPKLTQAEVKLVKLMVAGNSKSRAGMLATGSNTLGSGAAQASRMLKKEDVQIALQEAFDKHGINMDTAIAPIGKALKATKVVIHGNGEEAFAEEVEDIELQLKGADRALKLMNIGQNNETSSIHFHNHTGEKKADYDFGN